jgi:hypothetical protein
MAIVEDASAPAAVTNSTTTVTTALFTPVAGSLLVAVACGGGGTAVQTVPVTDSLGSTWTLLKRANTNNFAGETEIWVMDTGPSPASRTVTATITGSDGIGVALCVKVLTGAKPAASCLGGFTVVNSTTAYTISITTTTAGSLACAGLVDSTASGALTGPNGITTSWQSVSDTGAGHKYAAFRATSLTGTPGATVIGFTNTAANNQAIVAVEILAASAASSSAFVPRLGSRIAGTGPIPGGFMSPMRRADKISYVWPGVAAAAAVTLLEATAAWSAIAITPTPGQVSLTLTPATSAWTAVAVTPTPGQVALTLTPATAAWSAAAVTPTPGQVACTLTPASASWSAVPLSLAGFVTLTPASASWSAVAVTPTPGQVTRTLSPAAAAWSAVAVSPTPTVALTPALAAWSARPVTATPGSVALTIAAALAAWTAAPVQPGSPFVPVLVGVDASTSTGGVDSTATATTTDAGTTGTNLDTGTSSGVVDTTTVTTGMIDT